MKGYQWKDPTALRYEANKRHIVAAVDQRLRDIRAAAVNEALRLMTDAFLDGRARNETLRIDEPEDVEEIVRQAVGRVLVPAEVSRALPRRK